MSFNSNELPLPSRRDVLRISGGLTLTAFLAGCGVNTAVTTPANTPSKVESTPAPSASETLNPFAKWEQSAKGAANAAAIDKATPEEAAKFPLEAQLDFALYSYAKVSVQHGPGYEALFFDQTMPGRKTSKGKDVYLRNMSPIDMPLLADANPNDILAQSIFTEQAMNAVVTKPEDPNCRVFDVNTAQKLIVGNRQIPGDVTNKSLKTLTAPRRYENYLMKSEIVPPTEQSVSPEGTPQITIICTEYHADTDEHPTHRKFTAKFVPCPDLKRYDIAHDQNAGKYGIWITTEEKLLP